MHQTGPPALLSPPFIWYHGLLCLAGPALSLLVLHLEKVICTNNTLDLNVLKASQIMVGWCYVGLHGLSFIAKDSVEAFFSSRLYTVCSFKKFQCCFDNFLWDIFVPR